jgi:hypothetical protein
VLSGYVFFLIIFVFFFLWRYVMAGAAGFLVGLGLETSFPLLSYLGVTPFFV